MMSLKIAREWSTVSLCVISDPRAQSWKLHSWDSLPPSAHSLSVPGACSCCGCGKRPGPCDERVKVCHRAASLGSWVEPQRLRSKIPTWLDPSRDPFGNYLNIIRYGLERVLLLCFLTSVPFL